VYGTPPRFPVVNMVHTHQRRAGTASRPARPISTPGTKRRIYARVNGYLKNWYFDFGARGEKGQVLADIDAPEIDAQLTAAKAKLNAGKRRGQGSPTPKPSSPRRPTSAGGTSPRGVVIGPGTGTPKTGGLSVAAMATPQRGQSRYAVAQARC